MSSLSVDFLLSFMHSLPPEAIWGLMLFAAFGGILGVLRLFGPAGLYVYVAVAVIGANIQVLKAVQFGVYSDPVPLGTVLFASSFLATDILAEHYGPAAARRAVWLGFLGFALMVVLMLLTLGFRPMTADEAGPGMAWALGYHDHIAALFQPQPAFLIAGMSAYLLSQHHDIWLFGRLRRLTGGKRLWLRNNASTALSALIDNTVFSLLAWVVFASDPVGWEPLLFTYILGTYLLRLLVAALDTPFLYLARRCLPPADRPAPPRPAPPRQDAGAIEGEGPAKGLEAAAASPV